MQNVLVRSSAVVIQPCGSLNSENAVTLQHQLSGALLAEQHDHLLVDMEQVELIDSAGLMVFVSTLCLAQRLKKRLSLCSISYSVQMIFELAQLDRVFEILDGRYALMK